MRAEASAAPRGPVRPARRYRGAIIGLGGVATQAHLPAFREHPEVAGRFAIVCAADPTAAARVPDDGLLLLPDAEALDGVPALDFVDIATPSATHAALAHWALARGLHVLCEKPVATRRREALALAALARRTGRVLLPCHQYRFNPVWRRIGDWLAAGAIGRWHLAEIAVHRTAADRGASAAADVPWRARRAESGGGVLVDHGTHLLYTLLDLGGMPERLSAWTGRLAHPDYEVEDTAELRLESRGRVATVFLTWAARRRETRVYLAGERGAIHWTDGLLTLERDGASETLDCTRELGKAAYPAWFAQLFLGFAGALDAGAASPAALQALDDVVRVATLLEAAYASARSGATVTLPRA